MRDVLAAHGGSQKVPEGQSGQLPTPIEGAVAPRLTRSAATSSTNLMMMQGMKTVLQQAGVSAVPILKPPTLGAIRAGATAGMSDAALASPQGGASATVDAKKSSLTDGTQATPSASVAYQPGQEPKNLAVSATATPASAPATPAVEAVSSGNKVEKPEASTPSPDADSTCVPEKTSWTKTCAEAGYPDTFVGQVVGETQTGCGKDYLRDVWVSNTCADASEVSTSQADNAPAAPKLLAETSGTPKADEPRVDAVCGAANGMAVRAKPGKDLCLTGRVGDISGQGPWAWSCQGLGGGMSLSCAAPLAAPASVATDAGGGVSQSMTPVAVSGHCGAAQGSVVEQAPADNLCDAGTPSRVYGSGPWTWACSGVNGGSADACSAVRKVDGACGAANDVSSVAMPMADLCAAGYASAVTGSGPWNWTCSGLNGGQAATCAANIRRNAVCGAAATVGHREAPSRALCNVGEASAVRGNGPWDWTCHGTNGGATVSCAAPISVNGSCGTANGVATTKMPADHLCAAGQPSRVMSAGAWQWSCAGLHGGDTESCTAPVLTEEPKHAPSAAAAQANNQDMAAQGGGATRARCGTAAELASIAVPTTDLCQVGTPSKVSGAGPWAWMCVDDGGQSASCSTLAMTDGFGRGNAGAETETQPACGSATQQAIPQKPTANLCGAGTATQITGSGPWQWSCEHGKAKVSCEAPLFSNGACGAANGSTQLSQPLTDLCASGIATDVEGSGPWQWSCVGAGGGVSTSCSATAPAQERVDGLCGAAVGKAVDAMPSANLCDSGVASAVYGNGLSAWTWTCSGMNGGIASSCSTPHGLSAPPPGNQVNGLCGLANGAASLTQPVADTLCAYGTATSVVGHGPWNWGCLGENGGMTVSCTAPLQPPAAIVGVCGAASGVPASVQPRSGLCSAGIVSAVNGKGPWTWSCSGINGGGAVACVAPLSGSSSGKVSSLPSLVTTSAMPAAPAAAPLMAVAASSVPTGANKGGNSLKTPHLMAGTLPPIATPAAPSVTPSAAFDSLPQPSVAPAAQSNLRSAGIALPNASPELPAGTTALQPPSVPDVPTSSADDKPIGFDEKGKLIAGNHFILDEDVSSIAFDVGVENFDASVVPTLDRLVDVLKTNNTVRVTMTSYASSTATLTPRDARRLSLTRVLAVRDYLSAKGIPATRVNVRALGANVTSGDPDRIDIRAD